MFVRYSSKAFGEPSDMVLSLYERNYSLLGVDPLGRQFAQTMVTMNRSYSRGAVRLNDDEPAGAPRIEANVLGDPRDLARMVEGFRLLCEIFSEESVASLIEYSFVANMMMGIRSEEHTSELQSITRISNAVFCLKKKKRITY